VSIERLSQSICILLSSITLICLVLYILQAFPESIEGVHPKELVEVEGSGCFVGSYLWINRSHDVVVQAFVLFAAALGGLLFFKTEKR
jgi:hypothetical protein